MTIIRPAALIMHRAELPLETSAEQIMSMSILRPRRWTRDEVDRLIEERAGMSPRYELVDGALLVTPAPTHRHQRLILQLTLLLHPYLTRHKLGETFLGPSELKLADGERYEPDLFVLRAIDGRRPTMTDAPVKPLLLVCESLSPGSARHDRITKRRSFQRSGVPDYWIIDGDARAFEVWRSGDVGRRRRARLIAPAHGFACDSRPQHVQSIRTVSLNG